MPYLDIWVHLVWTTKYRKPLLKKDVRFIMFKHMFDNARKKGIYIDVVNGYSDHVHCLVGLDQERPLKEVVRLIKGESSNWINKQKLLPEHFGWQNSYWAASISHDRVPVVRGYIKKQEQHHSKKSLDAELDQMMSTYGWKWRKDESDE